MFLRINKEANEVETSRGAKVPLDEALRLCNTIVQKKPIREVMIGHYTVRDIDKDNLYIGCHTIPLKEIYRVFDINERGAI